MDDRDQLIEDLDTKHGGRIEAYETPDGDLIVVAPPPNAHIEYKRYLDALTSRDESKGEAQETFALVCVAYPEPAKARAILRKYPVMCADLAKAAQELLGGKLKKLGKARKKPNETT